MSESNSSSPASVDGLWTFLLSVDWQEPWLMALVGFHVLCIFTTTFLILVDRQSAQICTFLLFLAVVYASEYINAWAAENYRLFSRQQYFDSNGMFISLLLSTPLLLNCFGFIITWMYKSIQTLIKLKRAKVREEIRSASKKEN